MKLYKHTIYGPLLQVLGLMKRDCQNQVCFILQCKLDLESTFILHIVEESGVSSVDEEEVDAPKFYTPLKHQPEIRSKLLLVQFVTFMYEYIWLIPEHND